MSAKRSLYNFPGTALQIYLSISVLLFLIGPLRWSADNPWLVCLYVLVGQFIIGGCYYIGIRQRAAKLIYPGFTKKFMKGAFYVWVIVGLLRFVGGGAPSNSVVDAIADPASAYSAHSDAITSRNEASLTTLITSVLGPFSSLALASGFVFWKQLPTRYRGLWLTGICLHVSNGILTGTAKNIFDIVLLSPFLVRGGLNNGEKNSKPNKNRYRLPRISATRKIIILTFLLSIVLGGLWYFFYTRLARYGGNFPIGTVGWSSDLWGFALPEYVEYAIAIFTGYLCQGYYGLSGCLELPFVWSWGLGHSDVLSRYAGNFIGDPGFFRDLTYPVRFEAVSGYRVGHHWHTIYPWLASDVTFAGALAVVGIFGWLFARSWRDLVDERNPFAAAFFSQITLLMFFIPMHSSRLAWSEELISFWGLLILWHVTSASSSIQKNSS